MYIWNQYLKSFTDNTGQLTLETNGCCQWACHVGEKKQNDTLRKSEEQEHTRVRCYSDKITKHFHFLGLLNLKEVAIFCGTDLFSGIKYQF